MSKKKYKARIVDKDVETHLKVFGAVCIEGAKWCGKTWTSSHHSNSEIYIGDPSGNFQNRRLAQMSPSLALSGEAPRLIDEWQEVPELWDAVRFEVDKKNENGLYILTGSSTPQRKGIMHSGAGRISRIRMRPMSLYESGRSSGKVSLQDICTGNPISEMTGEVDLSDIIDNIIRGGWPGNQDASLKQASLLPAEYISAIIEDDMYRLDGIDRDKHKMGLLLRSLARNESTTVTNKTLKNDIKETDDEDIAVETIATYLDVLNRLFLTDNQLPFGKRLRSSARVKQAEKRHLADPSLACALLGANTDKLIGDLNTLGFLFEALCERDLRIYAQSFGAEVYHYQDYNNREMDAVISMPDGSWCGFEIKLGANQIDDAAENLLKIKRDIEKEPGGNPPKALAVICGLSNAAYKRPDGIYVVPITALAP